MKLGAVAKVLGGEVSGDANLEVTRLVHPADAEGPTDRARAVTDDSLAMLAAPAAAAVVKTKADPPDGFSLIRFGGHERMALAVLTRLFDPGPVHTPGIDPTAAVAADATIGEGASIGALVSIGPRTRIGANTTILAGPSIGARVILAGGSAVSDHIKVGSDATLSAMAAVVSEVPAGTIVDGIPALRRDLAFERYLNVGRLKTLYPRVDDLKKRVEALEKGDKGG